MPAPRTLARLAVPAVAALVAAVLVAPAAAVEPAVDGAALPVEETVSPPVADADPAPPPTAPAPRLELDLAAGDLLAAFSLVLVAVAVFAATLSGHDAVARRRAQPTPL